MRAASFANARIASFLLSMDGRWLWVPNGQYTLLSASLKEDIGQVLTADC
jgi:hypothetical protein